LGREELRLTNAKDLSGKKRDAYTQCRTDQNAIEAGDEDVIFVNCKEKAEAYKLARRAEDTTRTNWK